MRRKDKEITDKKEIEKILKEAKICRIAFSENNKPYIVPVNYGYESNTLYFHSAKEGKKIDILGKNNFICFEVETDIEILEAEMPCEWGMKYKSVIGTGRAYIINDIYEKKIGLNCIMRHYSENVNFDLPEKSLENVLVIKIEIEKTSGKKSGD